MPRHVSLFFFPFTQAPGFVGVSAGVAATVAFLGGDTYVLQGGVVFEADVLLYKWRSCRMVQGGVVVLLALVALVVLFLAVGVAMISVGTVPGVRSLGLDVVLLVPLVSVDACDDAVVVAVVLLVGEVVGVLVVVVGGVAGVAVVVAEAMQTSVGVVQLTRTVQRESAE